MQVLLPDDVVKSVVANSGAGRVEVRILAVDGQMTANSGAGSVVAQVLRWDSRGSVSLSSGAGDVEPVVPANVVGHFRLKTSQGTVNAPPGMGLVEEVERGGQHMMRGTCGTDGPSYELESGVGAVRIRFAQEAPSTPH